ncbi:MAG TPA: hypothetical protein VGL66_00130 [Caulobacteraceae bacterium]|jgi:hypothetical protein
MSDADRYRQNAAECERLAERSTDPDNRDGFRKLAGEWRRLARDAERNADAASPDCNEPQSASDD